MYYEAKNGHLPPAFIVDNNGKPMHSWRVLILPFLDRKDLYDQYDFSEPWNGPHNSRLMRMCPEVFRCPSAKNRDPSATSYVAIVGNGTAWPGDKGVSLADIKDGPDNTIVLVEVADSDINWLEPRDVTFDQAIRGVNVDKQHGISSNHPGIANVAYADGHVECLSDETPPATLRALLTIAGGEKIE
jgi:prepilin-type processing-associated H-X9-DG protein